MNFFDPLQNVDYRRGSSSGKGSIVLSRKQMEDLQPRDNLHFNIDKFTPDYFDCG